MKPFLITTWYRPPNSSIDKLKEFEKLLQDIDYEDKESIIMGDINIDISKDSFDTNSAELKFITDLFQYDQKINEPTRVTKDTRTLIDHFYSNKTDLITLAGVSKITISDNYLIYGVRKFPNLKGNCKMIEYRDFKYFDVETFEKDLQFLNSLNLECYNDVNNTWLIWKRNFMEIIDRHAPLKKRGLGKAKTPWINKSLLAGKWQKNILKRKACKTNTPNDWKNYKVAKNQYNRLIKNTIKSYYTEEIRNNKGNLKNTWKTINQLISKQSKTSHVGLIKNDNDEEILGRDLPNAFNEHFIEVGQRLCREIPEASKQPEFYIKSCNAQFQFREVTENEVFNLLSNISTNKATGPGKIPAKLVKISAPFITKHLSIIFNQSLLQGTFPYDWKISKVIPIYKKGPKHDMNNYRPISVISTIAKVMEKIAHNQLYLYLQNENILSPSQHGFRQGYSTVTALLEITDRLYHNIDIGELNGVIFLDLRKAFDTIDHQIMLKKLRCYGIAGTAHNWFSSYLCNRSQYCQVDGNLSQPSSVLGGIPQGSILGPLLFLLYINDLPNCLSDTKCNMFADDTQLDRSSSDVNIVTSALNNDLKNVSDWLSTNKLSLNTEKTEYMIIGSH